MRLAPGPGRFADGCSANSHPAELPRETKPVKYAATMVDGHPAPPVALAWRAGRPFPLFAFAFLNFERVVHADLRTRYGQRQTTTYTRPCPRKSQAPHIAKRRSRCSKASSRSSSGRACTRAPKTRCTSSRKSSTTRPTRRSAATASRSRSRCMPINSVSRRRRRARHPLRPASRRRRAGGRDRLHAAARGRQVRQGRRAARTGSPAACTA